MPMCHGHPKRSRTYKICQHSHNIEDTAPIPKLRSQLFICLLPCPSSTSQKPLRLEMEITQVYAVVVGGIASAFLLLALMSSLAPFWAYIRLQMTKHLMYPYILNRHALIGPWSAADVLLQVVYLTVNLFCISFRVANLSQAGLRAGTLSLINLCPLFSGPHLDFVADLLGLSLKGYRRVHRSAAFVAFALAIFHVLVVAATKSSTFRVESLHPFVIIVRA